MPDEVNFTDQGVKQRRQPVTQKAAGKQLEDTETPKFEPGSPQSLIVALNNTRVLEDAYVEVSESCSSENVRWMASNLVAAGSCPTR